MEGTVEETYCETGRSPSQARRQVSADFISTVVISPRATCDVEYWQRELCRRFAVTPRTNSAQVQAELLLAVIHSFLASIGPRFALLLLTFLRPNTKTHHTKKGTISPAGFRRSWLLPTEACSHLYRASLLSRTAPVPLAVHSFRSSGESDSFRPAPSLTSFGNE